METRSCRDCNKAIIWVKKDNDKWNPPLDAESAQSGFCVTKDRSGNSTVQFTYMYRRHACSLPDIEAYDELKKRISIRKSTIESKARETAAEAAVEDLKNRMIRAGFDLSGNEYDDGNVSDGRAAEVYLDTPAPAVSEASEGAFTSTDEGHPVQSVYPSAHWNEEFAATPTLASLVYYPKHLSWILNKYGDVITVDCPQCHAVSGDLCIQQTKPNLKKTVIDRTVCVNPHTPRVIAYEGEY